MDNKKYTQEECLQITKEHRKLVEIVIAGFCKKLKELWKIYDKEIVETLENYRLQHLVKMVWDQVVLVSEKRDKYKNSYEGDLERYIKKWLPKNLASICRNTSIDLWNNLSEEIKNVSTKKDWEVMMKTHKKNVMDIMNIFCRKVKELWKEHDKDKEIPGNLRKYTYLLNHPRDEDAYKEWKKIHNYSNTHHVEWFLECDEPKLQYLVEMICDNVATAISRDAKYENIFEENEQRYMRKWLPKKLATICANTFVDLWNYMHENK